MTGSSMYKPFVVSSIEGIVVVERISIGGLINSIVVASLSVVEDSVVVLVVKRSLGTSTSCASEELSNKIVKYIFSLICFKVLMIRSKSLTKLTKILQFLSKISLNQFHGSLKN